MTDRPFCRYCGKPIRKRTNRVIFGASQEQFDRGSSLQSWNYRMEKPRSREEAQRLLNQQIVSVRWLHPGTLTDTAYICEVSTWDGESYDDPFFCNGDHAKRFAYAAARSGYAMPAYIEAKKSG